jgi:hypothetical protein
VAIDQFDPVEVAVCMRRRRRTVDAGRFGFARSHDSRGKKMRAEPENKEFVLSHNAKLITDARRLRRSVPQRSKAKRSAAVIKRCAMRQFRGNAELTGTIAQRVAARMLGREATAPRMASC